MILVLFLAAYLTGVLGFAIGAAANGQAIDWHAAWLWPIVLAAIVLHLVARR